MPPTALPLAAHSDAFLNAFLSQATPDEVQHEGSRRIADAYDYALARQGEPDADLARDEAQRLTRVWLALCCQAGVRATGSGR